MITTRRKKVQLNMDGQQLATLMSENNPGALSVVMEVMLKDTFLLLTLDDMNIRGPQVWVGYKDHCGQDLDRFMECIKNRDPEMVEAINREMMMDPNWTEMAVERGASWEHRP